MKLDDLNQQLSAEFGGPAVGALPAFLGDKLRPHKGGSSSSTSTNIPAELKPLATDYANRAMSLANNPYQAYTGQQVAGTNWMQNDAAQRVSSIFNNGDPTMNAARQFTMNALNSGSAATANPYSGSNPYLQQNIDRALGDITRNYNNAVAPGLTTQMVNSGSFGNTGAQAATVNAMNDLTQNLANTAAGMRMQDYGNQQSLAEQYASRNDQLKSQMLGLAPSYETQATNMAGQMMNMGNAYQQNAQQGLDAQYQNYLDAQNDPYKKLAAEAGVFSSGLGQTSTTKQSGGGK